jgi:hypothetical protein
MTAYVLNFVLDRDATFASGDGVAGLLDREVLHDHHGMPYMRGRTLKGLLSEEADNLLYALGEESSWTPTRQVLFGYAAESGTGRGLIHFGRAHLPANLRESIRLSLSASKRSVHPQDILEALTGIRRQTAVAPEGVPQSGTLRVMRITLRQTPFEAELRCRRPLTGREEGLLAATVLAWRRAGTGRNRGRGQLQTDLQRDGVSVLHGAYQTFVQEAGL